MYEKIRNKGEITAINNQRNEDVDVVDNAKTLFLRRLQEVNGRLLAKKQEIMKS
jgi:hypothetical protein